MKQFGKILALTVGFGILAAVLASVPSRPVAQAMGAAPVFVTNPGSSPVPVSYPTTPTVNVGNTPTVNLGVGNTVGINGSVQVGNTATSPVLVRDVDNAARHAFVASGSLVISGTDLTSPFTPLTIVPMGKRLVIEYVSVNVAAGAAQHLELRLITSLGTEYPIALGPPLTFGTGSLSTTDHLTRIYIGPGGPTLGMILNRDTSSGGNAILNISIDGYLLDCGVGAGCPLP